MKIAIIGAGAAGSVFAAYLRLGGAEVYLVDPNRAHMDAVAKNGLRFRISYGGRDSEQLVEGFHTAYSAADIGIMDIVIFVVKTTVSDVAIRGALPCIGPQTAVVSLQNGLGNEQKLAEYFPIERILYGSGVITTALPEPGVCAGYPSGTGALVNFGPIEANAFTDRVGQALKGYFSAGGCDCCYTRDIGYIVWIKALRNCGANPLIALTRLGPYYIMGMEEGARLTEMIWREGCDVAEAYGVDGAALWRQLQESKNFDRSSQKNTMSSTAQDMLLHRAQTEIDSLNGAIVALGKKMGIQSPVNETIACLVKIIQANYEHQFKL